MGHDRELAGETRAWLVKSANDLRSAETLARASPPLLDEAVFHCQQAAEKALKGFLTFHSVPFRKTHNLEEIGEQCVDVDATLRELIDEAAPLTEYAWKFRYPGDPEGIDDDEVAQALNTARRVFGEVVARLPQECRP
jgi:HEPN domain-containing protein